MNSSGVRRWYACFIVGYVVMPEHVHLVISAPERSELSIVIQMLKQNTSRKLKPPGLRIGSGAASIIGLQEQKGGLRSSVRQTLGSGSGWVWSQRGC
jgi:REP element-mobilizing transposase RayT